MISGHVFLDIPHKEGFMFNIKFTYLWIFHITENFGFSEQNDTVI